MDDLLSIFDTLPNKIHLWRMMRYFTLIYKIHHGISIEIHKPRNTTEMFTYYSDKFWSKLIYGLSTENFHKGMLDKIDEGSRINLKQYWYPIFLQNNYLNRKNLKYEISYYIRDHNIYIENIIKEKTIHQFILDENKVNANILNYIKNIKSINKDTCVLLLRNICKYYLIDDIIINEFYKYIVSPPTNPCSESENRADIIILLEYYM
jgi:hypothetical protein